MDETTTPEGITPEEQKKRDKRLGIGYSIFSVIVVGFLLFICYQHIGDIKVALGVPLSDEDSRAVLLEDYAILGEYRSLAVEYTERFNTEYAADDETRQRLYDDLRESASSISSSSSGLYSFWVGWQPAKVQPVSEAYQNTLTNLAQCRYDLSDYLSMLFYAIAISLDYSAPLEQEVIDEMWTYINERNNEEGVNIYLAEFDELYSLSDPNDVQAE